MNVEAVLKRLQGVRRSGAAWMACCPAHEDHSPSLSIAEGKDRRVLLHCFGGCSAKRVCEALKICVSDLFSERGVTRERKPEIVRRVERQITDLRSRLTPRDRERDITVVLASRENPDPAFARALALAVEGELVQAAFGDSEQ